MIQFSTIRKRRPAFLAIVAVFGIGILTVQLQTFSAMEGQVMPSLQNPTIIDNIIAASNPGYSINAKTLYKWSTGYGSNYNHLLHKNYPNYGTVAQWNFPVQSGTSYEVFVTWRRYGSFCTASPYTIATIAEGSKTVTVNQSKDPSGMTYGGKSWMSLGTVQAAGSTLAISLAPGNCAKFVMADAVAIVPVVMNASTLGDVNHDGKLGAGDLVALAQYFLPSDNPSHRELTPDDLKAADVNQDGRVSKADKHILGFRIAECIQTLPWEFGDTNLDGRLDLADLVIVQSFIGRTDVDTVSDGCTAGGTKSIRMSDVNEDGKVTIGDYYILQAKIDGAITSPLPRAYGDLTNDGQLTAGDSVLLQQYIVGSATPTAEQKFLGDMNTDGMLDTKDVNFHQLLIVQSLSPADVPVLCGNGLLDNESPMTEQCDDGNASDDDFCSPACTIEQDEQIRITVARASSDTPEYMEWEDILDTLYDIWGYNRDPQPSSQAKQYDFNDDGTVDSNEMDRIEEALLTMNPPTIDPLIEFFEEILDHNFDENMLTFNETRLSQMFTNEWAGVIDGTETGLQFDVTRDGVVTRDDFVRFTNAVALTFGVAQAYTRDLLQQCSQ